MIMNIYTLKKQGSKRLTRHLLPVFLEVEEGRGSLGITDFSYIIGVSGQLQVISGVHCVKFLR